MPDVERRAIERDTGALFSALWSPYDDKLFEDSVNLFERRLRLSGFDLGWFARRRCLDAGCGGGRNTVAMARLGASVLGIDLGEGGIRDARARAGGEARASFANASILDIPCGDECFDLVWCAGVLQHTTDAERTLDELTRVLRPGGFLYLLVYATEGLRWPLIQLLRPYAKAIGRDEFESAIEASGLQANKRRTFLDDLFVPQIDFYEWPRLARLLGNRGYEEICRWEKDTRLDHEASLESYRADIAALREAFSAGASAGSANVRPLFEAGLDTIDATLRGIDALQELVEAQVLSADDAERAAIGQGHHRVLAVKGPAG